MRRAIPLGARSILIGRVFNLGKDETASFVDPLDALEADVFLVGADARLVFANGSGASLLAKADRAAGQASTLST